MTLQGLLEGQRYCVQTQYLLYNSPVGPRSCISCELVPESSKNSCPRRLCWTRASQTVKVFFLSPPEPNQLWIIVVGVLVGIPVLLTPVIVYLFMYRCGRFKRWLRSTRYSIPAHVSTHTHTRTDMDGWMALIATPASSSSRICLRVTFASPPVSTRSTTTRWPSVPGVPSHPTEAAAGGRDGGSLLKTLT